MYHSLKSLRTSLTSDMENVDYPVENQDKHETGQAHVEKIGTRHPTPPG